MSFPSLKHRRILFGGGTAVATAAAVVLALGPGTASTQPVSSRAQATSATTAATSNDPNLYPFGAPTGNGDFKVPPPPESPTLVPTIGTKTTQRLYGADPFQEAVSVTQHVWPAVVPENAPTEN